MCFFLFCFFFGVTTDIGEVGCYILGFLECFTFLCKSQLPASSKPKVLLPTAQLIPGDERTFWPFLRLFSGFPGVLKLILSLYC